MRRAWGQEHHGVVHERLLEWEATWLVGRLDEAWSMTNTHITLTIHSHHSYLVHTILMLSHAGISIELPGFTMTCLHRS